VQYVASHNPSQWTAGPAVQLANTAPLLLKSMALVGTTVFRGILSRAAGFARFYFFAEFCIGRWLRDKMAYFGRVGFTRP